MSWPGRVPGRARPWPSPFPSWSGFSHPTATGSARWRSIRAPPREFASQVLGGFEDVARAKGLRVAAAYGGLSIREQGRAIEKADILVATPGRLEDLCERRLVKLDSVRILVLDEADRMLDMGFEPQVAQIVKRIPKERQTMFFSATLEGAVGQLASRYTHDPVLHQVE